MKTVRCPQCNLVCWNTVLFCNRCGFDMQSIIEKESTAADEQSFEQSGVGHSAQNSSSFQGQNPRNFSEIQSENQVDNPAFQQSYNRNSYENNGGNARNYQNPNQYGNNSNKTKKGLAITSLVLGIIGLPPFGILFGALLAAILGTIFGGAGFAIGFGVVILIPLIALISGIVALRRTNKMPMEFGGKGLAIAGICCSGFVLLFFPVIGAVAIPNLLAARRAANEGSAISSLRTLASAETNLRENQGVYCGDLKQLGGVGLIDTVLAKGEKSGYRFIITKLPTMRNDCAITATPVSDSTGDRAFYYSTEDGEIRSRKYNGQMADMNDEPINADIEPIFGKN